MVGRNKINTSTEGEEMSNKFDITSTALEKGIDSAKHFIEKLIMPAIEETGLLLKDQVTMWKFKNQVRILNKAKHYCEANNITTKIISLKLLCPLLDYSGIEDNDELQDKWAILLSNMVDSEQNIENHVFPYILSQLSTNEFMVLEKVYDEKLAKMSELTKELEKFRTERPIMEKELIDKVKELEFRIVELQSQKDPNSFSMSWNLQKEMRNLKSKLSLLSYREDRISQSISQPGTIPKDSVKPFELSNLVRLGLAKEEKEFFANSQSIKLPEDERGGHIDVDIDVDSNVENILTELGELFVDACKEKKSGGENTSPG